jgi:hypothetical protein
MSPYFDSNRAFRIVTGVLKEALRASGRSGVVVSGGGPEEAILLGWLDQAGIPRRVPSDDGVDAARMILLEAGEGAPLPSPPAAEGAPPPSPIAREEAPLPSPPAGEEVDKPILMPGEAAGSAHEADPEWNLEAEASALAGAALARPRGFLHLGTANKSCLLLSGALPTQPILPLGDVYASEVRSMAGSCTLPPCLLDASPGTLQDVDRALRAYLEEGFGQDDAFDGLAEPLRREVLAGLTRARKAWHPLPLVPKLSRATLGLDLDL